MENLFVFAALTTSGCFQNDSQKKERKNSTYPTEWNLADLYPSDQSPEFQTDQERLPQEAQAFADQYQGKITVENLAEALAAYDAFLQKSSRWFTYVTLNHEGHLNDAKASALYQKAVEMWAQVAASTSFFPVEGLKLSYEALQSRMKIDPKLAHYRSWIEDLFRNREHVLSVPEERILAKTSVVTGESWTKFFSEFLAKIDFELDGTPHKLEFILHRMAEGSSDKERRAAAEALSRGLNNHAFIFKSIYNNILLDRQVKDDLRHYKEPEDYRLTEDAIAPEVVKAMIEAVKRHYPKLSHRYYRIKAQLLKQEKLQYWDRSAPVHVFEVQEKLTYPEAVQKVFEVYGNFSPTFENIARQLVTKGWVDVFPREGKVSGAFSCPSSVDTHPYVLLNFMGSQRDLLTIAHEFGHAVHQALARNVGQLLSETSLALAETASTFAEKLTYTFLIAKATHNREKIQLLCNALDDFMNTVVRQTAFFDFEQRAHAKRKEGEVQAEDLNAIFHQTQDEALGANVEINACVDNFWMYISHFFASPFYVYSYVFGRLFVEALFMAYKKNPQEFRVTYEKFLASGGKIRCEEAAQMFGFDVRSPSFWDEVLSHAAKPIDQLEALCKKAGLL